jgi:hypothetical protein
MIDYINDAKAAAALPHSKGFASRIFKIRLCMRFATEANYL